MWLRVWPSGNVLVIGWSLYHLRCLVKQTGFNGLAKDIQSSLMQENSTCSQLAQASRLQWGLLAMALKAVIDVEAVSYAGWQVPIRTDNAYTKARITGIETARVQQDINQGGA
jgi:aspartate kinase